MELKDIKVIVGLSGGVDSSVAALLLKQAGFDVHGVYLKCYWSYVGCQSDQDRNSAARVASVLDIPFEVWDFEREYREKVINYFYDEYKKGRTPNPDVVCNREIKFGLFLKKALSSGNILEELGDLGGLGGAKSKDLKFIATGHYARIGITGREVRSKESGISEQVVFPKFSQWEEVRDSERIRYVGIGEFLDLLSSSPTALGTNNEIAPHISLFGGVDSRKDQSYFLYDIPKGAYEHILYPLGNLTKKQVREIAKKENLSTASRPDSSGICFIGEVNIEKFLEERIKEKTGEVLNTKGNIIGEHRGVEFYTIGQRHGFSIIKSKNQSSLGPLYVIAKNAEKNQLVVGAGEECKSNQFSVKINRNLKFEILNFQLFVRIRNLGEMIPCKIGRQPSFGYHVSSEPAVDIGKGQISAAPDVSLPAHSPRTDSQNKHNEPTSEAAWASLETGILRDEEDSTLFEVVLSYPVFGIAPGQSAVFYSLVTSTQVTRDKLWEIVGGGVIQ